MSTNTRDTSASPDDPQHTAILVVDVLPLFTTGELYPQADEMLPSLRRFLDAARRAGALRIFTRIAIPQERWSDVWERQYPPAIQAAVAPHSPHVAFPPDFAPESGDIAMVRDRYSAFIATDLESLLRSRRIRTVIVTGLVTNICVSSTARDAFQRDFHTVTLSDCTAARTREHHEESLDTLAASFGRVCTSTDILTLWKTAPV
jgi:ureidoacrylate peracid hydrolase